VPGPFNVAVVDGFVVLPKVIDPVELHEENAYPELAVAAIESVGGDASNQPVARLIVPYPDGLIANVT
jgi:hypothetical protein